MCRKIAYCPYPTYQLNGADVSDGGCIFHTAEGKQVIEDKDDEGKIHYRVEGQDNPKVKRDFINEFNNYLEKAKSVNELDISNFIFPDFDRGEWRRLWRVLRKEAEIFTFYELEIKKEAVNAEFVIDFEKYKMALKAVNTVFIGTVFFGTGAIENQKLTNPNFEGAKFLGGANFRNVAFSGFAQFEEATFSRKAADFFGATFSGNAYFNKATFSGGAVFEYATFSGEAIFDAAKFSRGAVFDNARFNDNAVFYYATYGGEASFLKTTFSGEAVFEFATFSDNADFIYATFSDKAIFNAATFSGEVNFRLAEFHLAEFTYCSFSVNIIDFNLCEIRDHIRFRNAYEISQETKENPSEKSTKDDTKEKPKPIPVAPFLNFCDLRFFDKGALIIEDIDLSKSSFWKTNFIDAQKRVYFIGVEWEKKGERNILPDDLFEKKEEEIPFLKADPEAAKEFKENPKNPKFLKELEWQYLEVRRTYEGVGKYRDAGDFFIGEMRAREELYKEEKKCFMLSLHWLYGKIADWGESVGKALLTFVIFWVFFSLLLAFTGFKVNEDNFTLRTLRLYPLDTNLECFRVLDPSTPLSVINYDAHFPLEDFHSFFYALQAMTFNFSGGYSSGGALWTNAVLAFARIIGVVLIAIIAIAVRRKFRRISGE